MTYGWSILLIAIVLGVLFSLGVFSNSNLTPRAQANNCRVYRPGGTGTTTNINFEGVCNGELPEYVAQFNGATSQVSTGTRGLPLGSSARSIFVWFYPTNGVSIETDMYTYGTAATANMIRLGFNPASPYIGVFGSGDNYVVTVPSIALNQWHFIGFTYVAGATTVTLYLDGQSYTGSLTGGIPFNTVLPGSSPSLLGYNNEGTWFQGMEADLQVYNTTFSANDVQSLYLEGIGGAPTEPEYLAAWWPLNGDTNDYSGNLNNGVPTSISYTSAWTNGYTTP